MSAKCFARWNDYGFEPGQYRSCREQIAAANWKAARILNHILLVMMSVYVILSLLNVIRRSFFPYYLISLIYTVLVEVLFRMPHHRDPKNIREAGIDIGSACAGLMFFGIIASVADPYQVATSFLVMQTLAALFLNYPFWKLMLFEFGYMLIFDLSSYLLKPSAAASGDVRNAFAFFIVSGCIAYFFHKERIRHDLVSNHYHFMAHVDSLTRLLNHQCFFGEVEHILESGRTGNLVFAVFDIDHFKEINDREGHQAGDQCIRAVTANMLWSLLHTSPYSCEDLIGALFPEGLQAYIESKEAPIVDYYDWGIDLFEKAECAAGRIGGDEFAVLVGGPDPMDRVKKIGDAIRTITIPEGGRLTCSAGCVPITQGMSARAVHKIADEALYEAKKDGRNRICFIRTEDMKKRVNETDHLKEVF